VSTFAFLAATALAGFATGTLYSRAAIRRLTTDLADAVHRATHDPLTGLPNRAAVPELFALASTADAAPAVILIDLDGFKEVNDTHGHHAGDQLLVTVGRRLASATGVLGGSAIRLGGDEFLLILPPTHTDMATAVACALFRPSATVQLDSHHGPVGLHPRASAGIALPASPDDTLTALLTHADAALYHAKHLGGSRYEVHTPGMRGDTRPHSRGSRLRDSRPGLRPALSWDASE
jgi:diguanylate cyclase (GGDEF)-like protein